MKPPVLTLPAAVEALSRMGVILTSQPACYRLNYRHGREETAQYVESLTEAIEAGFSMAADRGTAPAPVPTGRRISRRAYIRRHNQKRAARLHAQTKARHSKALADVLAHLSEQT